MIWIINDNIQFNPDTNKLVSLRRPDLSVTLTSPASRCLTLLLESYPEVVIQKSFFSSVWAEEGMLVPTNTLYQNISIIRRGLRVTGETDELLVATVPRKGFKIENKVKIQKLTTNIEIYENQHNDLLQSDQRPASLNCHSGTDTQHINLKGEKKAFIQLNPYLLMIFSFILGILLLQFPWWYNNDVMDYFDNYTISKNENGCHYFSKNDDIKNIGNFSRFKAMIMQTGLDCKKYPWIYFPSFSAAPALSAFVCKQPYESSTPGECITLYFRGYEQ